MNNVATLVLGSRPRQGVARLRAKREAESHAECSWECKRMWGNRPSHSQGNSHFGSFGGLPNFQSAIVGVKTGLHNPFGHLKHKLWPKERLGIKLTVWLPTTQSWESTKFPCVQVVCNMPLESSWRGLQLWFRPHFNQRSAHKVMRSQSCGSPNVDNFGTPKWEYQDKKPFGCKPRGEVQNILYGGRWWLPPSLGRGESCESEVARGSS
jgi:hypothetical protein